MIVISDNSALSALAETGLLDLLPRLFGIVSIPEAVRRECGHPGAPHALREWIGDPPYWLEIIADPPSLLPETHGLGAGEAASITLAWQNRHNAKLILDEKQGRRVAEALGIPKTGVVGILAEAAARDWLDFDEAIKRIIQTGFRISPALIDPIKIQLLDAVRRKH